MKKNENIALFDMDDTLCIHHDQVLKDLEKIKSPGEKMPVELYSKIPEYLKKRIELIRAQKNWWFNLKKRKIGFDILSIAKKAGYHIHIITKGPYKSINAWSEKVAWIRKYVPYANITITEDKGLVYGKVLVDDYPEYAERWLEWRPRGLVIMPITQYNKDFEHPNVILYDGKNKKEIMKALMERIKK